MKEKGINIILLAKIWDKSVFSIIIYVVSELFNINYNIDIVYLQSKLILNLFYQFKWIWMEYSGTHKTYKVIPYAVWCDVDSKQLKKQQYSYHLISQGTVFLLLLIIIFYYLWIVQSSGV